MSSTGMRTPSELSDSTNEFRLKNINALNICFGDGADAMFGDKPDFLYEAILLLQDTNKDFLIGVWDNDSLTEGWNSKERALASYISNVLIKEHASAGKRERVTDSFVNYLLGVLEFNVHPLSLELKADCYFKVYNKKKDKLFVIVDEDKHLNNISKATWWGEYQIAGELLASAFVNHEKIRGIYRAQSLFAIRVIGTRFTFYRAEIESNYITSLHEGFPTNKMYIYSYPVDQIIDEVPCFDYTDPGQRRMILDILIRIKYFVLQNRTVSR
ncbi:25247_t:CDS:2 [Dentiscutata erythropus]|uniref:25247_t:CDS:1 n=1 Tax=Dentiscutata erythropus TaxID=1348616 RepID=A0A9N9PD02_9GLOM|nr:25247_t:CDS:2 [Dentiscutata erythropus]